MGEGFRPSDDIAAIRDFPMPTEPTITDICYRVDVVNQLAKDDFMSPFHKHLKIKISIMWNCFEGTDVLRPA